MFVRYVVFVDNAALDIAPEFCSRMLAAQANAASGSAVKTAAATQVVCYLAGGMNHFCQATTFTRIAIDTTPITDPTTGVKTNPPNKFCECIQRTVARSNANDRQWLVVLSCDYSLPGMKRESSRSDWFARGAVGPRNDSAAS